MSVWCVCVGIWIVLCMGTMDSMCLCGYMDSTVSVCLYGYMDSTVSVCLGTWVVLCLCGYLYVSTSCGCLALQG